MRIKRITLSTLTVLMVVSQLTGCASTTQQEAVDMTNRQDQIEIEIAIPNNNVGDTVTNDDITFEWLDLALLESYPEFREDFDYIVGNVNIGFGKSGICYVDMNMQRTNNSTLRYAFNIPDFKTRVWDNEETIQKLNEAVSKIYTDLHSDSEARLAVINAYYNLFDTPVGYFNGNDTITRAEFLTGVYKAHNPVNLIEANIELPSDEYNPFVNQMLKYNYLDLIGNTKAYDGAITRAEAVYTLVQMYYSDALQTDLSMFTDLVSDVKSLGSTSTESKSVELNDALKNPDSGAPDELYKALLIARTKGIIDSETRWDSPLTKAEAIDMITKVYSNVDFSNSVKFEINTGAPVTNNTQQEQNNNQIETENNNNQTQVEDNQTENTDDKNKDAVHITKIPTGQIVCTKELTNVINSALSKAGLASKHFNTIKDLYYNEIQGKDNTVIHTDIVEKLVNNLKKTVQETNNGNNTGNNNYGSGSTNIEVDKNGYVYEDNNEYPSGDITGEDEGPNMPDITAGKGVMDLELKDGGDGGDLIGNVEITTP